MSETREDLQAGFRREIRLAAETSEDQFFSWFNHCEGKDAAFIRGTWDFIVHIAQPAAEFLSQPEKMTALEIGYGGGRILAAAGRSFGRVIGVDIHDHGALVARELQARGLSNFELLQSDGMVLPVKDDSIDAVYSFIVLQHVGAYACFENYFRQTWRVLKPQGIAVLYFGRKSRYSYNRTAYWRYLVDRVTESVRLPSGYEEFAAPINHTNLVVSMVQARRLARQIGFEVKRELVSRRNPPEGLARYGGQNGLVLRKP